MNSKIKHFFNEKKFFHAQFFTVKSCRKDLNKILAKPTFADKVCLSLKLDNTPMSSEFLCLEIRFVQLISL